MKSNYSFALVLVAGTWLIASTSLHAADTNNATGSSSTTSAAEMETLNNKQGMCYEQTNYYRANALAVDAFGTASIGNYTINHPSNARVRQNTEFGVGAGLNYFATRNFGIGAEAYSENTSGPFIDSVSANLLLRLPLGQSGFAPYAYGGGGHQFDMVQAWFAQAGAGLEYRFCPHVGLFLDARWVLPNETRYYGVARAGLRFAF
mgnify:CR=1 FL=1